MFLRVAVLVLLVPGCAVQSSDALPKPQAKEMALPAGATLISEINLSENDLLGMLKQAIPSFLSGVGDARGGIGQFLKSIDLSGVNSAVEAMTALRIVQYKLSGKVEPGEIIAHFESQLPSSEGWGRIFYSTAIVSNGIVAVYSANGKEYAGFLIDPKAGRNIIATTVGFIDVPKLTEWAGKIVGYMSGSQAREPATPEPQTPDVKEGEDAAQPNEQPTPK